MVPLSESVVEPNYRNKWFRGRTHYEAKSTSLYLGCLITLNNTPAALDKLLEALPTSKNMSETPASLKDIL